MNLWLKKMVDINEDGGQNENGGQSDIKSLTMATCQLPCPQIGQFAGERRNPRFSSPPEISHLPQPENLPKSQIPRPTPKLSRSATSLATDNCQDANFSNNLLHSSPNCIFTQTKQFQGRQNQVLLYSRSKCVLVKMTEIGGGRNCVLSPGSKLEAPGIARPGD